MHDLDLTEEKVVVHQIQRQETLKPLRSLQNFELFRIGTVVTCGWKNTASDFY